MTNMIVFDADDVTSEHELATMLRSANRITFMDETFIVYRTIEREYGSRSVNVQMPNGTTLTSGYGGNPVVVARKLLKYFGDKKQEQMVKFQSTDSMDDIYQKVLAVK